MGKQNFIDEFLHEFNKLIPEDLRRSRSDLEKNIKAAMQSVFNRMDLVTREEFDVQTELLSRTRALLEEVEKKLVEMERRQKESDKDKGKT